MDRFSASYEIESPLGLKRAAEVLAGEQSTGTFVRLAAETDELRARSGATIESMEVTSTSRQPALPCRIASTSYERGRIRVSWPLENIGASLPNLLSTVAGNLFELAGLSAIRLLDIEFPAAFAAACPGPQFGARGTLRLAGLPRGPMVGTIIKPSVGLSVEETAALVKTLAEAGIDFIKDDELQANGGYCPLPDRVRAVMRVLNAHADRTGKKVMYAFNITDEVEAMWRHADLVKAEGGTCVMVAIHSVGVSGVRALRDRCALPMHGHRAGWGLFSRSPDIGVSFTAWQKIWRLAGIDHLHVNGLANKFTEPDTVVAESARAVQTPICEGGPAHLAMPVYSSGQTAWQVGPARAVLNNDDFIFCAGGGIMSHPDGIAAGVIALRQAADAARAGRDVEEHARDHPELGAALETFKRPTIALG